jgi:3-dehydroquinate synthetase
MGVIQHGDRDILNFGHTIGHALEALEQFSLSHGEAVFHGMRMESFLCKEMGILSEKGYRHIQKMLHAAHIHTMPNSYPFEEMLEVMVRDKKGLSFVALEDIGKVRKEHLFQIEHTVLQHYLDLYDKTVSLCIG